MTQIIKKVMSCIMAFVIMLSAVFFMQPTMVRAEAVVDFTVTGGTKGTDYEYADNVLTIKTGTAITIANTNPSTATSDRIEVADGVSANITLAGVNIDVSGTENACAFKIADNSMGNVTVTLVDNNILKEAYNKLFNTTYKTTSFNIGCMTYNYKNKKYVAYETECTNINNYELVEDIINMYEEDNELVIETIMGVFSGSNLYNYTNLYSPINTSYNKDNPLRDFKGSLSSYKYTFEKEKDNYKFISIEKN